MSFDCDHIYIHWPFCRNKCFYCDFTSFAKSEKSIEEYHESLCKEIREFSNGAQIKTIFIGGGSPSLYPIQLLKELFVLLRSKFDCSQLSEVTIEANPRDITEEKLAVWKEIGMNRLSMGIQMLDDEILKSVGRLQKNEDVFIAMECASNYFDNISVDLILGLPGATEKKWLQTLENVVKLPVRHVSVYFLTLYDETPLRKMVEQKELVVSDEDDLVSLYEKTVEYLNENGFSQYEISNFSQRGFESKHNQAYWDYKTYKGFGIAAASFDGQIRTKNTEKLCDYLNGEILGSSEELSEDDRLLERVMLGLRQRKKLGLRRMIYLVHGEKKEKLERTISELKRQALLEEDENGVCLTARGMVLENEVVLRLLS